MAFEAKTLGWMVVINCDGSVGAGVQCGTATAVHKAVGNFSADDLANLKEQMAKLIEELQQP